MRKIDIASKAIRNYKQAILAVRQNDQQLICFKWSFKESQCYQNKWIILFVDGIKKLKL